MNFKELNAKELHQINGGADGDFYKDVAHAAGYAYQSVVNWWDDFSYAIKRQGILGSNAPL